MEIGSEVIYIERSLPHYELECGKSYNIADMHGCGCSNKVHIAVGTKAVSLNSICGGCGNSIPNNEYQFFDSDGFVEVKKDTRTKEEPKEIKNPLPFSVLRAIVENPLA